MVNNETAHNVALLLEVDLTKIYYRSSKAIDVWTGKLFHGTVMEIILFFVTLVTNS